MSHGQHLLRTRTGADCLSLRFAPLSTRESRGPLLAPCGNAITKRSEKNDMKMIKGSAIFFLLFQLLPACGDDAEPNTDAGAGSTGMAGAGGMGTAGKGGTGNQDAAGSGGSSGFGGSGGSGGGAGGAAGGARDSGPGDAARADADAGLPDSTLRDARDTPTIDAIADV